jgi:hypothetical protein
MIVTLFLSTTSCAKSFATQAARNITKGSKNGYKAGSVILKKAG